VGDSVCLVHTKRCFVNQRISGIPSLCSQVRVRLAEFVRFFVAGAEALGNARETGLRNCKHPELIHLEVFRHLR
jgi:hypothetical protein